VRAPERDDADPVDTLLAAANRHYHLGSYDEAVQSCNGVLRLEPDRLEALIIRSMAYARLGKEGQSEIDYRQTTRQQPETVQEFTLRAYLLQMRHDLDGALRDLDRAILMDPASPQLHGFRARVREERGEKEAAAADYRSALQLAPPDWKLRPLAEEALKRLTSPGT